jgi:large subunit GTPase 1
MRFAIVANSIIADFATPRDPSPGKLVVGLVGYPNVGKSSTINALLGAKKVSVSSTPGKTKHFQTLVLSDEITLCDCPGLVFPQFANTQADMVVDGVLPIDQMREYSAPVDLLCQRIPREILEGVYGIRIDVKDEEEGGTNEVGWEDLLSTYASEFVISSTRRD